MRACVRARACVFFAEVVYRHISNSATGPLSLRAAQHHIHQHTSSPPGSLSQIPQHVRDILDKEPTWGFDIIQLEEATSKRYVRPRHLVGVVLRLLTGRRGWGDIRGSCRWELSNSHAVFRVSCSACLQAGQGPAGT